MKYVNKTFPTDEVNELEIYYHCFPDVEIHYRPFIMHNPIKNQKLYKFFKEEDGTYLSPLVYGGDWSSSSSTHGLLFSFVKHK